MTVVEVPLLRTPGAPIPAENYREYERRKQAWINKQIAAGLGATSFEYDQAIRLIAIECGI